MKALQRQMGGLAKLLKDLKATVDNLEKKNQVSENREIQEIIDTQRVIDEIIVANSDCIKRMEKELKDISGKMAKSKAIHDVIEEVVSDHTTEIKKRKAPAMTVEVKGKMSPSSTDIESVSLGFGRWCMAGGVS